MQEAAETYDDPYLRIVGHLASVVAYFFLGDPIKTRERANRVLALYSEERHGHLVGVLNHDPKSASFQYLAFAVWMLGYPEQAVQLGAESEAHARKLGHLFDLGHALVNASQVFDFVGEPEEFLKRLSEAERLGRENSMPYLPEIAVPRRVGVALIRKGEVAQGIATLRQGIAVWERAGGSLNHPYFKSVLAEGLAHLGDLAGALDLVDEVIAQIERPGWEERWYYAETLRIKGWLLALTGDSAAAERAYIASLDWARQQQAKSWELRTATSYARLMRDQDRVGEARDLLASVYGWFTEGFGTKDLMEAKALLDELSANQSPGMGDGVVSAPPSGRNAVYDSA
jgi:ATP/maltotriose-dependent transcriptional regulator MalT